MIRELREQFNRDFTPAKYAAFRAALEKDAGVPVKFQVSETPCFFEESLLLKLADAGKELTTQLLANEQYLAAAKETIPTRFNVPNEDARPLFVFADFGLVELPGGGYERRLVE